MSYIGTKFIVGQIDPNDAASDWIYLKVLRSISKRSDSGLEKMKQATAANDEDRAVLEAVRGALGKAGLKRAA
jgi:hypothetical protein